MKAPLSLDEGRQYKIFEVSLPSLTISVSGIMYYYETEAVIDSVAMIILIQEEYFRSIGTPSEWGVSVRGEHAMGKMIHNVLFTFGDQTLHPYLLFLHTVCVAPIKMPLWLRLFEGKWLCA